MPVIEFDDTVWHVEIETLLPMQIIDAAMILTHFHDLDFMRPVDTFELNLISPLPEWTFEVHYVDGTIIEALIRRGALPSEDRLVKITTWSDYLRLSEYELFGALGRAIVNTTQNFQIVRIDISRI